MIIHKSQMRLGTIRILGPYNMPSVTRWKFDRLRKEKFCPFSPSSTWYHFCPSNVVSNGLTVHSPLPTNSVKRTEKREEKVGLSHSQ